MSTSKSETVKQRTRLNWLNTGDADIGVFAQQTAQKALISDWPLATDIQKNIPIYDGDKVRSAAIADDNSMKELTAEWAELLRSGPGVFVIKRAVTDNAIIDRATKVFENIIAEQRASKTGGADHFAKPGANDRIWNALQKHCIADPENFAHYYGNAAIAMAATAWLGPGYQVTAQVNMVNPGGAAQSAHRDYHLGFMTAERALQYPALCHEVSPFLTLQGGLAHCDMPIESGPTKLLPFSQTFAQGYAAFPLPEYQEFFEQHHVQLDMEKGDALFFNPALMHAAGANNSKDIRRMVNLFQISSAFGRAMESLNTLAMAKALYCPLQAMLKANAISKKDAIFAIHAAAEDYPFPTNLDTDSPIGGLVPQSQAAFMIEALEKGQTQEEFAKNLDAMEEKRGA